MTTSRVILFRHTSVHQPFRPPLPCLQRTTLSPHFRQLLWHRSAEIGLLIPAAQLLRHQAMLYSSWTDIDIHSSGNYLIFRPTDCESFFFSFFLGLRKGSRQVVLLRLLDLCVLCMTILLGIETSVDTAHTDHWKMLIGSQGNAHRRNSVDVAVL